jgi:hypothetical protein
MALSAHPSLIITIWVLNFHLRCLVPSPRFISLISFNNVPRDFAAA